MGNESGKTGEEPGLRRSLGLTALALFGIGDILGAGVYGLVGKISGTVGNGAWVSYVVAAFVAALTGLTYAEWTSRHPRAGGAAYFTQQAFRNPFLTFIVMYFVGLSGLFSVATTSRVFANYSSEFFGTVPFLLKTFLMPIGFVGVVALITGFGINMSNKANILCTVVEVFALGTIIALGIRWLGRVDYFEFTPTVGTGWRDGTAALVFSGASVAFFAFIGFEDMANLSEEARNPERDVPWAICIAILVTSAIYCTIALIAVSVLPPGELKDSKTPLIDVVRKAAPWFPWKVYTVTPTFAVFNTGLLNLLMASRLLYGMSRGKSPVLPRVFSYLHPHWRTPVIALALVTAIAVGMICSSQDVSRLASGTTTFLLIVFLVLHVGLILEKRRGACPSFRVPVGIPVLGGLTCLLLLGSRERTDYLVAGGLAVVGGLLFAVNWYVLKRREVEAID